MKAKVKANGVLVRKSNTNMSPVIGSVALGTIIDIEAEYGEWVKLTDGGWVKACYTEAVEVSGGGVTSWNDLTDKPFYDDRTIIEWDGDTDGLTCVGEMFYKVSDLTPTREELIGGIVRDNAGPDTILYKDSVFPVSDHAVIAGEAVLVVTSTTEALGMTFNEAGMYFANDGSAYVKSIEWGEGKKLDPKYLPDPVVFTMSADTGEITCNKTYEECAERLASGDIDAEFHMAMMGAVFGIMKSASCMSGAMSGEDSVKYYFSSPADGMMAATLVTISPDGVEAEM